MKLSRYLVLGCFVLLLYCRINSKSHFWKEAILDNNNIYLVFRGTKSKEGFFAREFNIKDSLSSHVGLLINYHQKWNVYHVLDFKDGYSDLRRHDLTIFLGLKKERLNYASIWLLDGVDSLTKITIRTEIKNYQKQFINFDKSFSLEDSTNLYCSEFIFKVLNKADSVNFNFKKFKIKLNGVYMSYFRKDSLEYYPVDTFQFNENIVFVKEWFFD